MSVQYLDYAMHDATAALTDVPVWRTGAFAGEFGDCFIEDTSLEGGHVAPSIGSFVEAVEVACRESTTRLPAFTSVEIDKLHTIAGDFKVAMEIEWDLRSVTGPVDFGGFLGRFMARVRALGPGQRLVFGGGWMTGSGGHAILHVLDRSQDGQSFGFTVCNTGQGVSNHPMSWESYPKKKARTTIYLPGITPSRVMDDAVWCVSLLIPTRLQA